MAFTKKAQDRDNSRIFKSIEETAKILELQASFEHKRVASEIQMLQKEKQKRECAKIKAVQLHKLNIEKSERRKKELEEERKKGYELLIRDAQERLNRIKLQVLNGICETLQIGRENKIENSNATTRERKGCKFSCLLSI